ncbi:hypothetical protein PVAP13_8KG156000 [Panicum virgatum]|uniref:SREBP regulating gene protein n=1 Tax=Panicum virgatum TaxID=38727 RepID=A0A8T0PRY3_PANVG|nr:hypothetical protein PVAP13_8KG156000 [Panicum virgatum]
MAGPRPLPRRILRLAVSIAVAAFAFLPTPVSGIRKDIGFVEPIMCRSTVQGRHLISDDNGYVCSALSINPWSHCCPTTADRFSCQGCKHDLQCCNSYEYCVSCCLNPSKTKKEDVLKLKVAKPVTAGTYTNVFDFCMGRCRHSSASVVHGKCLRQRLPSLFFRAAKFFSLQKYMRCKSGCFHSLGPYQPAEVVVEAPTSLNPGACLYMQMDERLTCDGSHQHTRRLCPCA